METTPFFILLFIHLSGLILGFGSVLVTDLYGLLWIRDRVRFPQLVSVSGVTEKFIWAGWGLMVAAGIPLLILKGVIDNLMILKLFFVAIIGINGISLHMLHKKVCGYEEGDQVPSVTLFRLALALFVSQLAWWGAVVIGFLHRHVQPFIEWPDAPWFMIGIVVAALLVIWASGEMWIRRNPEAADEVVDDLTP